MTNKTQRGERRSDALTKERIVETAIELLDTKGESALTFRALMAQLATGSGAIYWHVSDKNDLLAACTDFILEQVMTDIKGQVEPAQAIRALALGIFDALDEHPWIGTQLLRETGQNAMLQLYEKVGGQLLSFDLPKSALFNATSALVNYMLGVAGQNAANARQMPHITDRTAYLTSIAERWARLDPQLYPFANQVANELQAHDDREQFLAGIDLILAGIATLG